MKMGLLALLLLIPALCIDVNKTVTGPQLLDIGQTLEVETIVTTDKLTTIDRIEDPIPASMDVSGSPQGCSVQQNVLRCPYGMGMEGRIIIGYTLTAKSKDKQVPLEAARVYYNEGGIPSAAVSNSLAIVYSIGPPELNFTARRVLIDGVEQSEPYMALPESSVSLSFGLKNSGAIVAENVTVSVSINQWGISQNEVVQTLQPDEERPVRVSFTAPKAEGSADASVTVTWSDPILHKARELSIRLPLSVSRPHVKADRSLELKWTNIDGQLTPVIFMQYTIKNQGKLSAKVVLNQEVPDLSDLKIEPPGTTSGRNTTISVDLAAGDTQIVTVQGKATGKDSVVVPASIINYYDSRNYQYETFSWDSQTVQITYSIWATIYSFIGPFGAVGKAIILALVLILAVAMYHLYKSEQPNWHLLVIPLAVLLLLVASYFVIEGPGFFLEIVISPINWAIKTVTGS